MVFVPPKDRVLETSNSNSQTVFALGGAPDLSYNAFAASMSVGDTTIGAVVEPGVAFRSGILTYSAANQITVTTTKESKGTFSSSGTKEVFMDEPASFRDASPIFSFEGDSLTDITGVGTWPLKISANSAFFDRGTKNYFGLGGDTAALMVGEYASQAGAVTLAGAEAYFFLWAGTNDIGVDSATAATVYGYLTTLWAAARTSGYQVVAFTIMRRGPLTAPQEVQRQALNVLIRSDQTLYDYLVTPDTLFPSFGDGNFRADQIHLTEVGNLFLAKNVASVVLGFSPIPAAPFDALAYNGLQINGACDVDQANAGTLVSAIANNAYAIDGWIVFKNGTMVLASQQVADAPVGLSKSLKISVTTAEASLAAGDFAVLTSPIEGFRTARLAFGSVSSQALSIGFWTKHHRIGLYGGSISNSAVNRSYPFSYTHHVIDTWQFNVVNVPGDVTGTWIGATNGVGMYIAFGIGVGTTFSGTDGAWAAGNFSSVTGNINGVAALTDTFQITGLIVLPGVDLPDRSRAPLILRPFDQEFQLCMRYYEKSFSYAVQPAQNAGFATGETFFPALLAGANTSRSPSIMYKVRKRATPTLTFFNPQNTNANARDTILNADAGTIGSSTAGTENGFHIAANGNASSAIGNALSFHWTAAARL